VHGWNLFELPRSDSLHLDQIFREACNLLDKCLQQTIPRPISIPIQLVFGIERYETESLREIGNICNMLGRQCLKGFLDKHLYLTRIPREVEDKYVLGYYVPCWMRDFFLNPNHSQHLYSTSVVIDECQKAIESLILDPNPDPGINDNLIDFFTPMPTPSHSEIPIADATHLLKSVRNASDRHKLLLFLKYLSEIHWFNIYNKGWSQRHLTDIIVHWVCATLVG